MINIDWQEVAEDHQCDPLCRPSVFRIKGGLVCNGCDACVLLLDEAICQEIEIDAQVKDEIFGPKDASKKS